MTHLDESADLKRRFGGLERLYGLDGAANIRAAHVAVVGIGGVDSQKNHSLGIFRGKDDQGPLFRNTPQIDFPEVYASYLLAIGSGLT